MSIPATERLKSSVRKAKPRAPRWRRWSTVSPSGLCAVEVPAFLMVAATPLSSNGLYEVSTRWWRWRSLISLLRQRSCWAEQAVNCLLKAWAIAFRLEWVFLSKAIDILGGGLHLLPPSLRRMDHGRFWGWKCSQRIPAGTSTGLALLGGYAAGCPGPAAWWQGREGHQWGASLSPRWGVTQRRREDRSSP